MVVDDIRNTKFWHVQYAPRIRFLRGILSNNIKELNKFNKLSTAQKIVVIDNLEAKNFFKEMKKR